MNAQLPLRKDAAHIVLLWLGRLGDLLIASPMYAAVRRRFPDARITLVTGERGAAAAGLLEDIDEVRIVGRFHRPFHNAGLALGLAAQEADILIDLNSSFSRSAWTLARLARARCKLAFRKGKGDSVYTHLIDAPDEKEHMLDRYARLARALGAEYEPKVTITISKEDRAASAEVLRANALPLDRRLAAVFPGNFKKYDNRWPEEKFVELVNRIQKRGDIIPFFLAGPGEEDKVRAMAQRLKNPIPVVGPLPIGVTAGLLTRLEIFITNCTGTTHLAIAAGCPTFSFLSRYTQTVWMPRPSGAAPHFCVVDDSWESCRSITVDDADAALTRALTALQ